MAQAVRYRIDPTAPLGAEIRRLVTGLLDAAVSDLRHAATPATPAAADVAAAVVALDEARALLRLTRAAIDRPTRQSMTDVIKAAQHQLDADPSASVAAATELAAGFEFAAASAAGSVTSAALHRLRLVLGRPSLVGGAGGLTTGALWMAAGLERPERWADLADRLEAALLAASLWPAAQVDGFAGVGPGLEREYRRAREAFAALPRSVDGPDDLELTREFATRSLDHHRHLRLLRPVWPRMVKIMVHESAELVTLAQRQHQLGVLRAALVHSEDPQLRRDAGALVGVLDEDRRDLAGEVRALGSRIYAEEPAALEGRFASWWSAAAPG